MRIVRGKVVRNTVALAEGAEVEVLSAEPGEEAFDITDEMHRELDEAHEALARGEGIDFDAVWSRLPPP